MSERLQRLLINLHSLERASATESRIDTRARIIVTLIYLAVMLSVPTAQLTELLLYALFPIICALERRVSYPTILRRSLWVVPFAALVGVLNIFYNREVMLTIGAVAISRGSVEFLSIIVRATLSVQAVAIVVRAEGYNRLCLNLQRLGVPALFVTQLVLLYRYLAVIVEQLLSLTRARAARSFGGRAMPLNEWGAIISQLTIRSIERSERIGQAMAARGFEGRMPDSSLARRRWKWCDTLYLALWGAALISCRLLYPVESLARLLDQL